MLASLHDTVMNARMKENECTHELCKRDSSVQQLAAAGTFSGLDAQQLLHLVAQGLGLW
jgi:hypothetical protein